MDYNESKVYLKDVSKYGSILGLDSITELLKCLDNPQNNVPAVHFAGTNGKGSTIAYVESILMEAGYKVGKYTSPAVFNERECIQINGEYITEDAYSQYVSKIKEVVDAMVDAQKAHPTVFEIETAMAFMHFSDNDCDIVLLETGMGGVADATNVVENVLCSVITSISLDHTDELGKRVEDIAKVKAGIIKNDTPVIVSEQKATVMDVINVVATEKNAEVIVPGEPVNIHLDKDMHTVFDYESEGFGENSAINQRRKEGKWFQGEFLMGEVDAGRVSAERMTFFNLKTKMAGAYQPYNAAVAIEVARVLDKKGFELKKYIKKGIQKATISGRFEMLIKEPYIIIDGAHNPGGAKELKRSLEMYFTNRRIAYIMGVLADKDYRKVAEITAPLADYIVTITPDNPRALSADRLAEAVSKYNNNVFAAPNLETGIAKVVVKAKQEEVDVIVAFGSLSYLGDVKKILGIN